MRQDDNEPAKMVKVFIQIFKWMLLAIGVLMVAFFAVNWQDEDLKPEVQAVLDWQPPTSYDVDNGYLALMGIDAPATESAQQAGLKTINADIATFREMMRTHKEPPADDAQAEKIKAANWGESRCKYHEDTNCVDFYLNLDKAKLNQLITEYEIPLKRYEEIKKSPRFVEVNIPKAAASLPSFSVFGSASELNRIQAVRSIADNQEQKGIHILVDNALLTRRMLKASNSLITHMVAISMLKKDAQLLSELLIKYPHLAKTYQAQLQPILETIATPDLNLEKTFKAERDMMLPMLVNLKYATSQELFSMTGEEDFDEASRNVATPNYLYKKLYQGNATANLLYEIGTLRLDMVKANPAELNQAIQTYQEKRAEHFKYCLPNKLCFKNPIGKILAAVGEPDFANYVRKHHDAEGQLRLINLQLNMLADPNADRAALLAHHPNPYTKQAMGYDSATGQLTFEGKALSYGEKLNHIYRVFTPPSSH